MQLRNIYDNPFTRRDIVYEKLLSRGRDGGRKTKAGEGTDRECQAACSARD